MSFDVNGNSDSFGYKKNEAVDQAVSCLRAQVYLVPFDVFLNIFVAEALHLLVCQLHSDGVFGFAC